MDSQRLAHSGEYGLRQTPVLLVVSLALLALLAALLTGCAGRLRGGRDGPGTPPPNLEQVPDAQPRVEAIRTSGGTSKPYSVMGRSYEPITDDRPFRERGLASWYGSKFHNQFTASGEPYDMYAMTAAHKTLPLPSYARVHNPANGREVIVRVNDRGPFVDNRIIDLSYTAAYKLDLLRGVAPVEIERITNEDIRAGAWQRDGGAPLVAAAPPAAPAPASAPAPVRVPAGMAIPVAAALLSDVPASAASAADAQPSDAAPARAPIVVKELPPLPAAAPASSTATPAITPVATPAAAPPSKDTLAGFWVQLGAFREPERAEGLRERATRVAPTDTAWLRVLNEGGTYRLQAGPYASREAAANALAQWRERLNLSPFVVESR